MGQAATKVEPGLNSEAMLPTRELVAEVDQGLVPAETGRDEPPIDTNLKKQESPSNMGRVKSEACRVDAKPEITLKRGSPVKRELEESGKATKTPPATPQKRGLGGCWMQRCLVSDFDSIAIR